MGKLSREDKLDIYRKWSTGETIVSLCAHYGVSNTIIKYLVRLVDYHGVSILNRTGRQRYSVDFKTTLVHEVLINGRSRASVAIEYGLPCKSVIRIWIQKYQANGCIMVKKTQGKRPMLKQPNKPYEHMTTEEKLKHLEQSNAYLRAENDYLKKLDAVLQKKNKQAPKRK